MSNRKTPGQWLVLLTSIGACASPLRAGDKEAIERAREIWQLLVAEQFDAFVATGDAKMQSLFSGEQAGQIWKGLAFRLGEYQTVESATHTPKGEYGSVSLVCRFERGSATIRLVLNHDGQMSGLWLNKVEPDAPYQPPSYVDPDAFHEQRLNVVCGAYELPGTLTLPRAAGAHPGVVLVHGSGPHDEDETVAASKPFRDLAWGLASRGAAVLRYEKRTHKYRERIKPEDVTLEWETIDDALAAARLLRQRPEIDAQRVFVLGHSLGGMAAPFIAARDDQLAGLIILAGSARSPLDLIEDQIEYLAKLDGDFSADERQQLAEVKQATTAIRAGKLTEVEKPLLGAPTAYWARLHALDPAGTAAKLELPILIIHGGRDYQVSKADYAVWKEQLGGRQNVTIKLYEGLNHLMAAGEGASGPEEYQQASHVDEAVIADITKWIEAAPRARSSEQVIGPGAP